MIGKTEFCGAMKLADLVDANPNLAGVLMRLGIAFGFGEQTLEEACADNGLDSGTVILICNVYSNKDFVPSDEVLSRTSVADVVRYLHASHAFYLNTALVRLSQDIGKLIEPCEAKFQKVIWKFFSDYQEELEKHFKTEENDVLPYVEGLLLNGVSEDFSIDDLEETHADVEEKLEDLKNLIMKALPAECDPQVRTSVLFYLYYLTDDLKRHTCIEDDILVPLVRSLEQGDSPRRATQRDTGGLSEREKEILVSVAQGMLNKEIADKLCISIYTVVSHRKNITRKTGIKSVAGLTVYAILNGLIDINSVE